MQYIYMKEVDEGLFFQAMVGRIGLEKTKQIIKDYHTLLGEVKTYEKLHKEIMPEKGISLKELINAVDKQISASRSAKESKGVRKEVKEKII